MKLSRYVMVIGLLGFAQVNGYSITVKNNSDERIFFSYDNQLKKCGAGKIWPEPKVQVSGEFEHTKDLKKDEGVLCAGICFTKITLYETATGKKNKIKFGSADFIDLTSSKRPLGACENIIVEVDKNEGDWSAQVFDSKKKLLIQAAQ